ncbi:MAG: AMP-binding protein, partial [Gammaproteobacteria bacterium]
MSDKNIDSILSEDRVFAPDESFAAAARLRTAEVEALHREAAEDHEAYWARLARDELVWSTPFEQILDDSNAPNYRWFADGALNVSHNCLDVHLEERGDKTAIVFEGEGGDQRALSYRELTESVCRFANALRAQGMERGDRIVIYMPMVPEAVVAMQACARIGAVHSVVFGGFSAGSLRDRIVDAGAKMVITADGGHRGGKIVELKAATDEALSEGCPTIEKVIVLQRTDCGAAMREGRDIWWSDAIAGQPADCAAEPVDEL